MKYKVVSVEQLSFNKVANFVIFENVYSTFNIIDKCTFGCKIDHYQELISQLMC